MLKSVGIALRDEWIADYPVTPIILAELQDAVFDAAEKNKLSKKEDEAVKAFQSVKKRINFNTFSEFPGFLS